MQNCKNYEAMAKLNLTEDERKWVCGCADLLIHSFKALENADVSGVEPLVTVLDIQNVLREDSVVKTISRDELMRAAPEQYDGYFQVPKALD